MKNLICAVAVLSVSIAQADTIYVDNNCPGGDGSELDPYCSIQTGIDNAVSGVDEVVVAAGTYLETINFLGKAIWLRSSDGAEVTIIDAQQTGSVVTCDSGEGPETVLEGFTVTGGDALEGGGMLIELSNPTVTNCIFNANTAERGAGVFVNGGCATFTNSSFSQNVASRFGGGMYNIDSSPTLTDCDFTNNSVSASIGGSIGGGGISNSNSSPTISNCTFCANSVQNSPGQALGGGVQNTSSSSPWLTDCAFSGNSAGRGGGMDNFSSSPTVTNCTFSGNTATGRGGGMAGDSTVTNCTFSRNDASEGGGMSMSSSSSASNCSFTENTANNGGGMHASGSSPILINCIFANNFAFQQGGGVFGAGTQFDGSAPTFINCVFVDNLGLQQGGGMYAEGGTVSNCTFTGNAAADGGGIATLGSVDVFVINSILWGNTVDSIGGTGGATVVFSDVEGGFAGAGNINADPLFVQPAGGDLHLGAGSPCIDAANEALIPPDVTTDLDGNPRFIDDPRTRDTGFGECPIVDMGAYEFQEGVPGCCPADLDGDNFVGIIDFLFLLSVWGTPDADIDGDGDTGITDFLLLLASWGPCP